MFGVLLLVPTAFAPHATSLSWVTPALMLASGAVFSFFGFNARRAARVYRHPGG